ncbi:MAG: DMT family transporter [Acidobacteria bacterium]|nr:DMT family transporter [Acidobacteriota bacterium]
MARILLLSAVIIWGWTFVATKILLAEIGPIEIIALRLAIGLPFLALVVLVRRVPLRFAPADARPLLLGGAILTLHFLIQIGGLKTTTATNTGWIVSVSPLALAVLSFVFLRERIGWRGVGGIAIATAGIVLLVSRGRLTDLRWLQRTGDWLELASAHTWAFYTVATRDLARRRDPLAVAFAILLIAAALTAVIVAATGDTAGVRSLSPRGLAALLYLAIPGLALGQWFWQEGVRTLGAAGAGFYLYLEPIATLTLAVPLLGEPFSLFVVFGGGLVLTGVYIGQSKPSP